MSASKQGLSDTEISLKEWFNTTFTQGGQDIPNQIGMTIHSPLGSVVLPVLPLRQTDTVRQIILKAIKALEAPDGLQYFSNQQATPVEEINVQEPLPPGYDLDHVEYRKKTYIVHSEFADGQFTFTVERQEDRKIIDPSKATWRHVVDAYKQAHPGRFTEE